uniref:Uncharacterized protein n=1 Tax=Oryza meridionalis TaxID=40149 RepID=A0A0E0DLQ6_9ORYZ
MGFMAHLPAPLFFPASSWSGARTTVGAGGEGVARAAAAGGWPAGRRDAHQLHAGASRGKRTFW